MESRRIIPRCMSSQHPDNVNVPFFANDIVLEGEDEIQEAYYAFSHLGCDEQMWDAEGKEVDSFVVKKLLSKHANFFEKNRLGKDTFITLRVPNPSIEVPEAKILLETLESIPRSYDAADFLYGDNVAPIFEVILPMTTSHKCLNRIYHYYREFVAGKQNRSFTEDDITVAEWIGRFKPESINVIPLFEDMEHMLDAHTITGAYLQGKDIQSQRVFLARSDTAMNYGFISAVLLNKIALQKLHRLSGETGVEIHPIIGVGSAPFRGNLKPSTVDRLMEEYPSVSTFTIQASFKFDNPPEEVRAATQKLHDRQTAAPHEIDEAKCMDILFRYSQEYQRQIMELAPVINAAAAYVPARRKRKLHTGLFGYSRKLGDISLPRAISFTSALYSIGLPPEILGLNALTDEDITFVRDTYLHLGDDLNDALRYFNPDTGLLPEALAPVLRRMALPSRDNDHGKLTESIVKALNTNEKDSIPKNIVMAAGLRNFLG